MLDELVERDLQLSPTLTVMEVAIPAKIMRQLQRRVGEYHAAGGRVTVGSDSGMPGVPFGASLHCELELLVESGLTPQQALKGATSEASVFSTRRVSKRSQDPDLDAVHKRL